jgi:hypothetical protein
MQIKQVAHSDGAAGDEPFGKFKPGGTPEGPGFGFQKVDKILTGDRRVQLFFELLGFRHVNLGAEGADTFQLPLPEAGNIDDEVRLQMIILNEVIDRFWAPAILLLP